MGKNVKVDSKKRRKRVITGFKRLRANERERVRVQKMNAAFMELKQCLPPNDQKRVQTKIDIICYAASFIKSLKNGTNCGSEGRNRGTPTGWGIKSSVSVCEQRCCQTENAPTIVSSYYSFIPNEMFPNSSTNHSLTIAHQANSTNTHTFSSHSNEVSNTKAESLNTTREFYADSSTSDQANAVKIHNMQIAESSAFVSDSTLCTISQVSNFCGF